MTTIQIVLEIEICSNKFIFRVVLVNEIINVSRKCLKMFFIRRFLYTKIIVLLHICRSFKYFIEIYDKDIAITFSNHLLGFTGFPCINFCTTFSVSFEISFTLCDLFWSFFFFSPCHFISAPPN